MEFIKGIFDAWAKGPRLVQELKQVREEAQRNERTLLDQIKKANEHAKEQQAKANEALKQAQRRVREQEERFKKATEDAKKQQAKANEALKQAQQRVREQAETIKAQIEKQRLTDEILDGELSSSKRKHESVERLGRSVVKAMRIFAGEYDKELIGDENRIAPFLEAEMLKKKKRRLMDAPANAQEKTQANASANAPVEVDAK